MSSVSDKAPRHHPKRKPTQFVLKQSWEQKKLSFMPNFKQVGHCKASASLSQSSPRHFLLEGSSDATSLMVECSDQVDSREGRKWIFLFRFAGLRLFRAQKGAIVTEPASPRCKGFVPSKNGILWCELRPEGAPWSHRAIAPNVTGVHVMGLTPTVCCLCAVASPLFDKGGELVCVLIQGFSS